MINHGPLSGDHSVLLFSKPPSRGIDGIPLKQLVSFERVHLEAGAGQEILFKVNPCEDLGTVGDDGIRTVDLGEHTLMVGMVQHVLTVVSVLSFNDLSICTQFHMPGSSLPVGRGLRRGKEYSSNPFCAIIIVPHACRRIGERDMENYKS